MVTLVTGATGLVGFNITQQLLAEERSVRALVRSVDKAEALLPAACELAQGDVTDKASILAAMDGVSIVYHAAGIPEQWLPDDTRFNRVNVDGTRNMVEAALARGVEKFIYTSTIDVFDGRSGEEFDESRLAVDPKGTAYERSKQQAYAVVLDAITQGLPALTIHPSALYGPGPSGSAGVNDFFSELGRGKMPMLVPGGTPVVHAADVGRGHLLAEADGTIGASYILSESYQSLKQIAKAVAAELALNKIPPMMPLWFAQVVAAAGAPIAQLIKKPPLIPKGQLHFLQWGAIPVSEKAQTELGWQPRSFAEGLAETIIWLRDEGRL